MTSRAVQCGGLSRNGLHRLLCLNVWSPVGLFRKDKGCGLVGGGVTLGVGFEVSKTQDRAQCLCLLLVDQI